VDFNVRTEKGNGLRMAIKKSKSDLGRVWIRRNQKCFIHISI
jgi:hypothetical protein